MEKRYQVFPSNEILDNSRFKKAQIDINAGGKWIQTNESQAKSSSEII